MSVEDLPTFIRNLEEAVEDFEQGSLMPETEYKSLEAWDSLAVLTVIAMVDAEYSKQIKAQVFKETETVEDLYRVIADA